ncbi:MAG: FAD-binding oxidoreductase [Pseudomonadota bacterium]
MTSPSPNLRRSSQKADLIVVGGGLAGATTALFAARAGMRVVLFERETLGRGASGVNAGTLTLQMTRLALIPYALKAHDMWANAREWLGHDVGVQLCEGLSVAFTEAEEALLAERATKRAEAGAPIKLVTTAQACAIEPGLSDHVLSASHATLDGFADATLTGVAYRKALLEAGVVLCENTVVRSVQPVGSGFEVETAAGVAAGRQLLLAGGVWLEEMAGWLGVHLPIKTLVNQLAVTERAPPVMRTVLGIASGLLSLKQYPHGTVVIGGGWQGSGDRATNDHRIEPESLIGNVRLAQHTIPALRQSRIVRAWSGFEAETDDALPAAGPLPGHDGAWILGSVHSGYTSLPYLGRLMADAILGRELADPLFPIDRLISPQRPHNAHSIPA